MEEISIEGLSHEGRGIAHLNGKTIFIENALPEERVRFQYTNIHGSYDEGKTVAILHASPNRVEPPCAYHALCGGCSLQHLTPEAQLKHKETMLLEQLKHFGQVEPENILEPLKGPTLGYRHKARLGVRYVKKKEKLVVGFREKNGRYITDIQTCSILHASIGEKIGLLQALLNTFSHVESIPQIEVAVGDSETALVIRHLETLSDTEVRSLIDFSKEHAFSIYLQPNSLSSVYKLSPDDKKNELSYSLTDHSITLYFHPCHFTQINPSINRLMIHRAKEWLDLQASDHLLDLFCGLGNFSLPLSKYCASVSGVEGELVLVEKARENARRNQLTHVDFYLSNLSETIKSQAWMSRNFNKLLLDPPRTGALEIIQQLHDRSFDCIVYISCNPSTFARDAGELVHQQNYRLAQISVMDMFPHTTHVESIGLFLKRKK